MERQQPNQRQQQQSSSGEYINNKNIGAPPALMVLASTADVTRTTNSVVLPRELPNVYSAPHNRDSMPAVYGYPPGNINALPPHYAPLQTQLYEYDQYGELALHAVPVGGDFRQHVLPIHHAQLQTSSSMGQAQLITATNSNINHSETIASERPSGSSQIGAQFDGSSGAFKRFTGTKDKTTKDDIGDNADNMDLIGQAAPSDNIKNDDDVKEDNLATSNEQNDADSSNKSKTGSDMEKGRDSRTRRKRKSTFSGSCPICGITIRTSDLQSHLDMELKKMNSMVSSLNKNSSRRNLRETNHSRKSTQQVQNKKQQQKEITEGTSSNSSQGSSSLNEIYESVRRNRIMRSKGESSSDKSSSSTAMNRRLLNQEKYSGNTNLACASSTTSTSSTLCPVCNQPIAGNNMEVNNHVNNCLGHSTVNSEESNRHPSDKFVEYDWCGESRVRATALVEEDLTASGFEKIKKTDENENVVIDVDVSEAFGKSQYTEADLIPCSADEAKEERSRKALRQAMLGSDKSPKAVESSKWTNCKSNDINDKSQTENSYGDDSGKGTNSSDKKSSDSSPSFNPSFRCLICMEPYCVPLTSINCWHVHCEECWMRTLGAKKLCPQCNVITSPADLRKIYL